MDLVNPPRVKQHPLRKRRLARIDVRRYPDVPEPLHRLLPPRRRILLVPRSRRAAAAGGERPEEEERGGRRRSRRRGWRRRRLRGGTEGVEQARLRGSSHRFLLIAHKTLVRRSINPGLEMDKP